jgi:hypothetical protein
MYLIMKLYKLRQTFLRDIRVYTVRVPNNNQDEYLDYYPDEVKLYLVPLI